jgi:mono/diheme cytochrome c family protein
VWVASISNNPAASATPSRSSRGPALSKESLGGQADVMAEVIGNGVPLRMPGFKQQLNKDQIRAVVAYIQTLDPPPPEAAKPTARTSGERRDDN